MKFRKFSILDIKATGSTSEPGEVEVLFNLDHIISIKPIRISRPDKLMNGFWIRTTNGKKYRASKIPDDLLAVIGEQYQGLISIKDSDDQPFQ
jgi:hypothetical protein